jgi:hypothetical protein
MAFFVAWTFGGNISGEEYTRKYTPKTEKKANVFIVLL